MGDSRLGHNKYEIRVVDGKQLDGFSASGDVTTGCLVFVYDAGTKTLSTLYGDAIGTTLANPITRTQFATDGMIKFYGPNTSYDVVIAHSDGSVAKHASVGLSTHVLPLNRDGVEKCVIFPMVFNAGGTVTDTGIDLPLDTIVTNCLVEVVTTDATETVDIGLLASETNGDEDGFRAGVSVAVAGYVAPVTYTVGSNETYLASTTYGALVASYSVGNDVATDVGSLFLKGHIVTGANAKSITYTPSSSDTFAGYGYVFFRHLR